jgi:hypothetical protein
MEIKLIKNEKINNIDRAKEIHLIEIKVNKIENIDEELAEKFLRDIIKQNIHLDFTKETWNDVKEIIVDKLEKITRYPKGYLKNDGTIIPLIANYVIEKIFKVELLTYSENIEDIEIVPKGFDSLFLDKDLSIFLCEHKSSISKLNEEEIANKFISGYKSIFCTNSSIISKISTIKTRIENENISNKKIIKSNLNELINRRRELEEITNDKCAKFNICCITKSNSKLNLEGIIANINKKFSKEEYCEDNKHKKCNKYAYCQKIRKIKVINIIIIKIPDDFKIENFYENIIKKIEEKVNE